MGLKAKLVSMKNKVVKFVNDHKTEVTCVGIAICGFVIGAVVTKNLEKSNGSTPIWDHDALGLKEGDFLNLNTGEVSNSLEKEGDDEEEFDWNKNQRILNWELAKEFASKINLEDGEFYTFENGNSHGDGYVVDNGLDDTEIYHGVVTNNTTFAATNLYPEDADDHEWECQYDVMDEINAQNARILNFANTIDFAENTSYTIEKNEDGKTQVVYKQWLSV